MTFIQDVNIFMTTILSIDTWNVIEIIAGFSVFFGCLLQRVNQDIFQTTGNIRGNFIVKVGQLGLYGQMMMGLLTIIDGYYNYQNGSSHTMIALWALSSCLVKYSVYLNLFKIVTPKRFSLF